MIQLIAVIMAKSKTYKTLKDPKLIKAILSGGTGVLPTDTIYGLVASAADVTAVEDLYRLKHRHHKPGTLIAANIDQLTELGIARRYATAVADLWPNPISVVLPVSPELHYLSQDKPNIAVRIPDDKQINELLLKTGPLITSSANMPGEEPITEIKQAQKLFGDYVDFYVDGGYRDNSKPSTVIRIVDDAIEVLREGAIKFDDNGRIIK